LGCTALLDHLVSARKKYRWYVGASRHVEAERSARIMSTTRREERVAAFLGQVASGE
jgi:hypothetical protein